MINVNWANELQGELSLLDYILFHICLVFEINLKYLEFKNFEIDLFFSNFVKNTLVIIMAI